MRKKCLVLFVTLGLFVLAGFAQAADDARSETDETETVTMEEVVVAATRYEEKISAVPANITVITEGDIANSTAKDIPSILRTQVGIHVTDVMGNRRNYRVDLRGFGETAQSNTLVLVDGRRINQADLSGTDWALIPLDRVKRIEIIRGGRGSVLYGDNAAAGVINIITKEGDKFKTGAEVLVGSYDTFIGNAYVSGSYKSLSYAISGNYLNSDGYRDNSDTEAKDLGVNLGYFFGDLMQLNLSAGFHEDDTRMPGPLKASDFAAGKSRRDTLTPDDFADVDDYYIKVKPEIFFLDDSRFQIDLSFRKRDSLFFSTFTGGTFEGDTEIKTVAASPQIILKEKVLGLNNNLTFGFDFIKVEEDIFNTVTGPFPSTAEFTLEKKNRGYYIHDEIYLLENLALSGGYRYDQVEYKFDPSTPDETDFDENPLTAGVNYNFYKDSSVYFSFSESFRYPVLDELYNFFTNTINDNLAPQTSDDCELGIRHYFTKSLYANINFFRIDTEDEIFFNLTNYSNENLDGKIRRDGVEIALRKTFENVSISAGYTYSDTEIKGGQFSGNEVPNVPKHKASLDAVFDIGRGFTVALNGIYIGERLFESDYANTISNQDDYIVLNAKFKYNWKNLTAFLDINNITDEKYSEYGVLGGVEEAFYPSPERNFFFGVSVDY
jgi:iron complex outermembrane receptor protein